MRQVSLAPALVALALPLMAAAAGAAPTVCFEPASLMVEPGENFSLSIRIDAGIDTLSCFLVEFEFDAAVIELTEAIEGNLFARCGDPTMFHWDTLASGKHSCNDVVLGYMTYVLCPGELVHLDFRALEQGATRVEFTAVDLRDIRREPIVPVNVEGAVVGVCFATGVEEEPGSGAAVAAVRASPNPFASVTTVEFEIPHAVREPMAAVYDAAGRFVARLPVETTGVGRGRALWRGLGERGLPLPSGVYFVSVVAGEAVVRTRVTLVR